MTIKKYRIILLQTYRKYTIQQTIKLKFNLLVFKTNLIRYTEYLGN